MAVAEWLCTLEPAHKQMLVATALCVSSQQRPPAFRVLPPKKNINKVAEIISGMLPLSERTKLKNLLSGKFDTVLVESQRALARSAHTAEEVYRTAQKNKVNVVVQDMPTLYKLDANPAENFT